MKIQPEKMILTFRREGTAAVFEPQKVKFTLRFNLMKFVSYLSTSRLFPQVTFSRQKKRKENSSFWRYDSACGFQK